MTESASATPVMTANIAVHSAMAATYDAREPHFRPENQAAVRAQLQRLADATGHGRLLDLGCGTGFVINLAKDLFAEVHGVDITPAMLERVVRDRPNIFLHQLPCESLPFADASFDAATAYSFLDHLEDYGAVLREAARVLRPGAQLYADLLPNRHFWNALSSLPGAVSTGSALVDRELHMLHGQHLDVQRDYAIDGALFLQAEPWKSATLGILDSEFAARARAAGFAEVQISYQWFLGQGQLLHGPQPESAALVEQHLRSVLPLSAPLFKYLRAVLTR